MPVVDCQQPDAEVVIFRPATLEPVISGPSLVARGLLDLLKAGWLWLNLQ